MRRLSGENNKNSKYFVYNQINGEKMRVRLKRRRKRQLHSCSGGKSNRGEAPPGAFVGGVPLQGRCPCLYSVAPPGLLWVGCIYRGVAPACIPSPLRGFCGWGAFTGAVPLPVFRRPSGAIVGGVPIQGRCPCQDDWCSPSSSVAPPGLLLERESPGGAMEYRQGCNPCSCSR